MKETQLSFQRYEKKYLMPAGQHSALWAELSPRLRPDEYFSSTVCSLYYDTEDYSLIRHSIQKPVYKEKLRLRSYRQAEPESDVFVELKKKYDCIIVDAPPCALVSDPITIAEAVDSTVLVIKQDTVRTTRIRYALENLHSVNAHIMGCVLNAAGSGITGYGYYYGGYGYAYNRYGYKKYGYGYGYRYGKK